jgi:hypothetical protein
VRTISIRLDDHTDAVLATYCERHGVTQTNAVKDAIEQLAKAHRPTPAEIAERLGLIGAFRSREGDLAANHSLRVKEQLRAKRARDSLPQPAPAEPDIPSVATRRRSPAR